MKKRWMWLAAAPLGVAPVVIAQHGADAPREGQGKEKGRLERVDPSADAQEPEAFDAESWKRDLTSSDLEQRERAFERVVAQAAHDADARSALEGWSRGGDELAWTARLALREVGGHAGGPAFGLRRMDPAFGDFRLRLDDLHRHFGGIDSMLEDLQSQMEELFGDAPGFRPGMPAMPGPGPGARQRSQSFSLEAGPDGVVLKTEEDVDGEKKTREYRADSLEELYEQHPELRDRIRLQGFAAPFGPGTRTQVLPIPPGTGPLLRGGDLRTDVLGIECLKPTPERAAELGLQPEVGLRVERTHPNTIASVLGIKRGDVVVEINGATVYSREDIAKSLRERREEQPVAVVLIDAKGQRRTLTWTPEAEPGAKPGAEGEPKKSGSGGSREF